LRSYQEQYDETNFPPVTYSATINSMEAMAVLLLTGSYVGFLPDHFAQYWVDRGELKRIDCPSFTYVSQHQWAFAPSSNMPVAFKAFSDVLEEVVTAGRTTSEPLRSRPKRSTPTAKCAHSITVAS